MLQVVSHGQITPFLFVISLAQFESNLKRQKYAAFKTPCTKTDYNNTRFSVPF